MKEYLLGVFFVMLAVGILIMAKHLGWGDTNTQGKTIDNPKAWEWVADNTTTEGMKKYEGKYIELEGYFAPYGDDEHGLFYVSCFPQNQRMFSPSNAGGCGVIAVGFDETQVVEYYEGLIKVRGKVEFGDYPTDNLGYKYDYKLTNATYSVVETETIEDEGCKKYNTWLTEENSSLAQLFDMIDTIGNTIYWKTQAGGSCEVLPVEEYTKLVTALEQGDEYDKAFSVVARDALTLAQGVNEKIESKEFIEEDLDSDKLVDLRLEIEELYMKYMYAFEVFNMSDTITYTPFDVDTYFDEQIEAYEQEYIETTAGGTKSVDTTTSIATDKNTTKTTEIEKVETTNTAETKSTTQTTHN
jgi:hypothetical protein